MEDKSHMCECCQMHCPMHGPYHRQYSIIRWILGIFIILFVFSIGMKVGQYTGILESGYPGEGYGYRMMRYAPMGGMYYYTQYDQAVSGAQPSATVQNPVKK